MGLLENENTIQLFVFSKQKNNRFSIENLGTPSLFLRVVAS